ncbi:MAG: hypothetical protein HRU20_12030 [Pseudomonadales bacterium]|nr:hypothetical protein [Pseudomonadales bacterium]
MANTDLQSEFDRFKKQTQRQIEALQKSAEKKETQFRVNGFATLGYARSDSKHYSFLEFAANDIKNENNFISDSKLGLQFTFKPHRNVEFVAQLLAEAKRNWQVEASWAYMKYTFSPSWSLKAGKMRLPYYLASEYIDVGYAYPWVRPPTELYSVFIENFTGLQADHRFSFGNGWNNQLKIFYGEVRDGEPGNAVGGNAFDFSLKNLRGIEDRLNYGAFTLRASYTEGDFDLSVQNFSSIKDKRYRYSAIAAAYDDGELLIHVELGNSTIEDYTDTNRSYTATLGYNIGAWLPYITQSELDEEDQFFSDTKQKSSTLGLRYFLNNHIALKASVQRFYDFGDTNGQFSPPSFGFEQPIEAAIHIVSFSINTLF